MDCSQFNEEQLKKRIREARMQIEILDQEETDMILELSRRKAELFANQFQKILLGEKKESVEELYSRVFYS
jgi:hypothetical protein